MNFLLLHNQLKWTIFFYMFLDDINDYHLFLIHKKKKKKLPVFVFSAIEKINQTKEKNQAD